MTLFKAIPALLSAALTLLFISGCRSTPPYAHYSNWALRQNAVPRYFAEYDLIYLYPTLLRDGEGSHMNWAKDGIAERIHSYAHFQTVKLFGNKVRVFSPMVHQLNHADYQKFLADPPRSRRDLLKSPLGPAIRDTVEALEFYLDNYHKDGRPFVLYGQGQGARLLYEAMRQCKAVTPGNGFVAAYLPGLVGVSAGRIEEDLSSRGIHPASGEYDLAAVAAWNIPDSPLDYQGGFVINPLNWRTDSTPAPAELNQCALFYDPWSTDYISHRRALPRFCGAAISSEDGLLHIIPNPAATPKTAVPGATPFGLFGGNVAANARLRVRQYIHRHNWNNELPPTLPAMPEGTKPARTPPPPLQTELMPR